VKVACVVGVADEVKNTNEKEILFVYAFWQKALRFWSFDLGWSIE
jgi:hypothetical protein